MKNTNMNREHAAKAYLASYLVPEHAEHLEAIYEGLQHIFSAHYVCKDDECRGTISRDAATLQEAGDPYCPKCDGEMEPA